MKNEAPITERDVERGSVILDEYKRGRTALTERIVSNEKWWRDRVTKGGTGWLFNAIASKHADAMDNYPSPVVLPREEGDSDAASALTDVLPVILGTGGFEAVYSDVWYDKLKYGVGCFGVFWNPAKPHGGDVDVVRIDPLGLFWEPGVSDIEDSENVFLTKSVRTERLRAEYPDIDFPDVPEGSDNASYLSDEIRDTSRRTVVVDWYYKRREDGRTILHLIKFARGKLIYSSENAGLSDGLYAHGKYPFFIDRLYPMTGSPCGYGMIDVMKDTQDQIDRLSEAIVKNAELSSAVRFFIRTDGSVNEEEFADFTKPFVHVQGARLGDDSLRRINSPSPDPVALSVLRTKIDELKETSGNRDFTQGGATGGITAAAAIAALQEAGNKLSRDMISASYRVFASVVKAVISVIRERYTVERVFRILGDGGKYRFVTLAPVSHGGRTLVFGHEFSEAEPDFDISVSAEKRSPFARVTQNELAKEFYAMGLFAPERREEAIACVTMMDFEGKDALLRRLAEGSLSGTPEGDFPTPVSDGAAAAVKRAALA